MLHGELFISTGGLKYEGDALAKQLHWAKQVNS